MRLFCCMISLPYRVTFLCNGYRKLIIHQKVLYDTYGRGIVP